VLAADGKLWRFHPERARRGRIIAARPARSDERNHWVVASGAFRMKTVRKAGVRRLGETGVVPTAQLSDSIAPLEGAVRYSGSNLQHHMCSARRPAHLLIRAHPAMNQPLHGAFCRRRRYWLGVVARCRIVDDQCRPARPRRSPNHATVYPPSLRLNPQVTPRRRWRRALPRYRRSDQVPAAPGRATDANGCAPQHRQSGRLLRGLRS